MRISITTPPAADRPVSLNAGQMVAFFDMNTVSFPLMIRNVRAGDKFRPLGMTGTQKITKFLKDHKIPAENRVNCPLLLSQEHVVWVMGHRIDDSVKITPNTRRILKVMVELD